LDTGGIQSICDSLDVVEHGTLDGDGQSAGFSNKTRLALFVATQWPTAVFYSTYFHTKAEYPTKRTKQKYKETATSFHYSYSFCFDKQACPSRPAASLRQCRRIADNDNDRISPQKHLADVPILVDSLPSGFPLSSLGGFRPHFLDVLQEPGMSRMRCEAM
jgi:hypothetical protein